MVGVVSLSRGSAEIFHSLTEDAGQHSTVQFTLKDSLIYVVLAALAIGGLFVGPPLAWAGCIVFPLLLAGFAINAIFGTGDRRAFAVSFLLPACGYLAITAKYTAMEYQDGYGSLPTSQLFGWLVEYGASGLTQDGLRAMDEHYRSLSMMPLGHLSVAVFLGYCFGYYGVWVRRQND